MPATTITAPGIVATTAPLTCDNAFAYDLRVTRESTVD